MDTTASHNTDNKTTIVFINLYLDKDIRHFTLKTGLYKTLNRHKIYK